MKKYSFIKVLFSPFKPFKIKVYCGKTNIGTPYFHPRKWIKATPELAKKATLEHIQREETYNRLNPKSTREIKPYEEIYQEHLRYKYSIPKKIGFDFVGLGWKIKWKDTDYRFEWSPLFSFVVFGYQLALIVSTPYPDHYWTSWLYYEKNTDKTKSKKERIKQCIKEFPQKYRRYSNNKEEIINYYDFILKEKYIENETDKIDKKI